MTIYFALCPQVRVMKVGYSADPEQRMAALSVPVRLVATEAGDRDRERELHRRFAKLSVGGEWFRYRGELVVSYVESLGPNPAPVIEAPVRMPNKPVVTDPPAPRADGMFVQGGSGGSGRGRKGPIALLAEREGISRATAWRRLRKAAA